MGFKPELEIAHLKYPEGTGVQLEVKTLQEITALKKLVAIKVAN